MGILPVESESQTSSPSHESESESLYMVTGVRVRVTKKVTRAGLESESQVIQVWLLVPVIIVEYGENVNKATPLIVTTKFVSAPYFFVDLQ